MKYGTITNIVTFLGIASLAIIYSLIVYYVGLTPETIFVIVVTASAIGLSFISHRLRYGKWI